MLHVASVCTPCWMLLDVVACCCTTFETSQTFQPTTPNISLVLWSPKLSPTMLDPFAQLFQHCWGHARSLRMVYKDLWVESFPRCTAGPNIVGSRCIRVGSGLQTDATTPNIVGATMLGVVTSVCTKPKGTWSINIFPSNYQHLLVVFTAALSPTISSTHYYWHTSQIIIITLLAFIKQMLLHISLQLFTITAISFWL